MASSDQDRAIAGEEIHDFPGFFFSATDNGRTIRFMGRRIQIYHKATYKMKVEKDNVTEKTDYEVPSGYVCEVAGGNSSSVQFV
jgi:hypothetical protein